MSREILHILQKFLMHIVFATNIDSKRLAIEAKEKPDEPYTVTQMSVSDANEVTWFQQL